MISPELPVRSPNEQVPWTEAELGELLGMGRVADAPHADVAVDDELTRAASVLVSFNPHTLNPLKPLSKEERARAERELMACSVVIKSRDGEPRWTLRESARKAALRSLQAAGALAEAIEANPGADEPQQRALTTALRGGQLSLDGSTPVGELMAILQVISWTEGVAPNLPKREEVQHLVARGQLLRGFHHLVGTHFRGRQTQLHALRLYVGLEADDSILKSIGRRLGFASKLSESPPLFVFGPGGVGKSTLLANFVLKDVASGPKFAMPFVYVDFDRPGTLAEDPTTLLLEAAAQLAVQFPQSTDAFDELRDGWNSELKGLAATVPRATSQKQQSIVSDSGSRLLRRQWIAAFAKVVTPLLGSQTPLLLILDTFEEAQARSHGYVAEVWDFLDALQGEIPMLRTVLSGRSLLGEDDEKTAARYPVKPLQVGDFDPDAALGYLESRDVKSDDARAIVRKFGGNPLTLNLAIELLKAKDGRSDLAQIRTKGFLLSLDAAEIQGRLYDRILSHIHDERVKQLAHPGLVMRRITADIILNVLADLCDVAVSSPQDAENLLQLFEAEVSLVRRESDGSLHHRSDVRKAMLKMMVESRRSTAEEIHRAAIDYYADLTGDTAREEELYHRLAVGDIEGLEALWRDDMALQLAPVIDELSKAGQAYLASRLGREVPSELARAADQETWELATEREVRNLLAVGRPTEAWDILQKRKPSTWPAGSRLAPLAVLAAARLGNERDARVIAGDFIDRATEEGLGANVLELTYLLAQVEELFHHEVEASRLFESAADLARERKSPQVIWESGLARLALHHCGISSAPIDIHAARSRLIEGLHGCPQGEWPRYAPLLRCVAGEVAADDPKTALKILQVVGTGPLDARAQLAQFLVARALASPLNRERAAANSMAPIAADLDPDSFIRNAFGTRDLTALFAELRNAAKQLLSGNADLSSIRELAAALRATGAGAETEGWPAAWADRRSPPGSHFFNPPDEIKRVGRSLEPGNFRDLLAQVDHSELVMAVFTNPTGALVATVVDSPDRLRDVNAASIRDLEYLAVPIGVANRGMDRPVRGGRLYQFTQLEREVLSLSVESDPYAAPVTTTGRPFIGRTRLREFLRNLRSPGYPSVLVVNGPRASGKSSTILFASDIASRSAQFSVASASIEHRTMQDATPEAIVTQLALALGYGFQQPVGTGPRNRWPELIESLLESKTADRTHVLIIDGLNAASPDALDFVVMLAKTVAERSDEKYRLVLIGLEKELPPHLARSVMFENLRAFTTREVRDYIQQLLSTRGFSPQDIDRVYRQVSSRGGEGGLQMVNAVQEIVQGLRASL